VDEVGERTKKALLILLDNFATALENNEIPTVEDSVNIEQLAWQYWGKKESLRALGLTTRVTNRVTIEPLRKEDVLSVINHCVQQKKSTNGKRFAGLIREYLKKSITAADLLGARDRRPRNNLVWSDYDQLGEKAELMKNALLQEELLTGNRSLVDGLDNNLYCLLSDLTEIDVDVNVVRDRYNLSLACNLQRIDKRFISSAQWREYHAEYKRFL
jgi:hypothetical protein